MSEQYPGGFITKTEPTVDGSVARGLWTLSQAAGYRKLGVWPTSPGAPTIGTATAGSGSASVAFTAPANTGSAAITTYTATSSPGGLTGTGASSPITVSGLTNGTAYTFTVTATNGAGTGPASAASNSVTPAANFVEDVFSTFLYTGNGTTQTITNGIDLSTKGGLVWCKNRAPNGSYTESHGWFDTVRGAYYGLNSNSTAASTNYADMGVSAFNTTGFDTKNRANPGAGWNNIDITYASWTFRKQPKFFDLVTWTGDGNYGRTVAHALGAVPGCIIVKRTDTTSDWAVYHRGLTAPAAERWLKLNLTDAQSASSAPWADTAPSSTVFTVSASANVNASGGTYVAYLYAHDAGGFGTSGADNVVSCGSFTADGSGGCSVTLGYEPQWIMYKNRALDGWRMEDVMRGWNQTQLKYLTPNDTSPEGDLSNNPSYLAPTPTGFNSPTPGLFTPGNTFVYVAIRRGPMRVPTDPNNVFALNLAPDTSSSPLTWNTNSTVDSVLTKRNLSSTNGNNIFIDRVRGNSPNLLTNSTGVESTNANITDLTISNGYIQKLVSTGGSGGAITYAFSRAPSFFDIVCYTGTGSATTFNHNLGVVPEMMIVKLRNFSANWEVYHKDLSALGTEPADDSRINLNNTNAASVNNLIWNSTPPTSTVFSVGASSDSNRSGNTIVNYLFATCAGVSKVGSYTGNGSNQTINCNFTAGTRFVLIRRADSTGDWYVWDSARGIVAGNDPHLSLNDTAAEVTTDDSVDTNSTGFVVNQNSTTNINVTSAAYIFLALA